MPSTVTTPLWGIRFLLVVWGLTLLTLVYPGSTAADGPVTTQLHLDFPSPIFVDTGTQVELVDFSGTIHMVVRVYPTDPVFPTDPIRVHTNLAGVSGVGQTTGGRYQATGAATFEFDGELGDTDTLVFTGSYPLFPPTPIRGLRVLIAYEVTINEVGEVTDATASSGSD